MEKGKIMEDLYVALGIFLKYGNPNNPTSCGHDALYVDIDPSIVSKEDTILLDKLGFFSNEDGFLSFKFGSN